ncbi:MAG TPA: TonB-dependent receptor [Lysobacter sp.]
MLTPLRTPLALALLAALPLVARAEAPAAESGTDASTVAAATATAAATALDDNATTLDAISVVGQRETRQVQRVGAAEIRKAPPGTNPVKMLEKLPGVHFVSSDPWGSYEWSNRIAIRGFAQHQLGYTLDGIPLGDNSYANNNGLAPNRAILSENVAELELAQGAGALKIPSTSNLGGALVLHSADPETEFGGRAGLAVGSDNLRRGFARIDTGAFGGFSAYLSAMKNEVDKWKGDGIQEQTQFNSKALYQWDAGRVALWLGTSKRNETDYQDLSLDLLARCGYDWDNYAPDWQRALDAATDPDDFRSSGGTNGPRTGTYSGCVDTYDRTSPSQQALAKDAAYFVARGLRDDWLGSLSGDFSLTESLTLAATAYYHRNEGQGHWLTPYIASPTVPLALRITSYDIERSGINTGLTYEAGNHTLEGGFWFEDSVHGAGRSFVYVDGPIDDQHFFDSSEFVQRLFRQRFDTTTRQWYLQDTMRFADDRLTVNVGFKGQKITTDATVVVPGRAGGRLVAKDNFMPTAGMSWKIDDHSDVFANYAESQVAFRPGVNGAWALGQSSFNDSQASAKPERSKTLELGWRAGTDAYQVSAAIYGVRFDDRQLVIVPCAGIISCNNQFANVGSVTTRGAELALILTPGSNFRWFNSFAWNESQYDEDYLNRSYNDPSTDCSDPAAPACSHIVRAGGKQVVDTPKLLFASEVEYQFGDFSAKLGTKYTGNRYYTYNNDAGVDEFWLWNAGLAWEKEDLGWARRLRVGLDVTNLFDEQYIATLGSNGFRDSDPAGTFATLLAGAPRQLFLSVDLQF